MPHYKNTNNRLFWLDNEKDTHVLPPDCVETTEAEAAAISSAYNSRVWGRVGYPESQTGGDCPAGWVEMAGPMPDCCRAQADGTWTADPALELARIEARQAELLAPADKYFLTDRTSPTGLTEWRADVRRVNDDYMAKILDSDGAMVALDSLAASCPVGP